MHIKITDFNILCVLQITEFIYGNNLLKSLNPFFPRVSHMKTKTVKKLKKIF